MGSVSQCCSRFLLLTVCSLAILIFGCSTSSLKQYVSPNIDIRAIQTIAVLPLNNFTSDKHANEKIRSKVNIELLSRGINVVEPGEIGLALTELKVRSMQSLRMEDMQDIGEMLGADAVILGSVETFGVRKGINVSYPEVSIHLSMYDTVSGNLIWSIWHTSGGASFGPRHFGTEGSTLDNVAAEVIRESCDALYMSNNK